MNTFASDLLMFLSTFGAEKEYDAFITHMGYGTADIFIKDNKIVGAVRWNVSPSGRVAHICDLFILPEYDGIEIMRFFGYRGKVKFPLLQYIKFDRDKKQGTKNRVYKLSSLIKG